LCAAPTYQLPRVSGPGIDSLTWAGSVSFIVRLLDIAFEAFTPHFSITQKG
jgi:hypothetical protein